MEDNELIACMLAGDTRAENEFFKRHQNRVRRLFINMVPASDVEDLCQETWIGFFRNLPSFQKQCAPRTFLLRIARNKLIDFIRRNVPSFDPLESSVLDVRPGPRSDFEQRFEHQTLLQALREIPADLQLIIQLYYWEEMPAREIAEVVDIPEGTVRSRIGRAIERLGEALARAGVSRNEIDRSLASLQRKVDERRRQSPSSSESDDDKID